MQRNWSERNLRDEKLPLIADEWLFTARIEQYLLGSQPPTWLVIGGRGAGKTRLGAEWVNSLARGLSPFALGRHDHIALVGETLGDVREVMVDGPSGIGLEMALASHCGERRSAPGTQARRRDGLHCVPCPGRSALDASRLCRAGARRVHAQSRRAPRGASHRRDRIGIPWLLYEGAAEMDDHPLLQLLARPNQRQAGATFLEALYGHLLLSGNAYVELVEAGQDARELHLLRPDRVTVLTDADGWPSALEYREGSARRRAQIGLGPGGGALQLALFHPLDDHYGFPPLESHW